MNNGKNEALEGIIGELKNASDKKTAEQILMSKLSEDQKQKLKNIISNDEAVKNFLSSEQAKKIIKSLTEKGE